MLFLPFTSVSSCIQHKDSSLAKFNASVLRQGRARWEVDYTDRPCSFSSDVPSGRVRFSVALQACLDSPCGTVIVRSIKLLMCVMKAIVCYDGDVEVEDESGLFSTSG